MFGDHDDKSRDGEGFGDGSSSAFSHVKKDAGAAASKKEKGEKEEPSYEYSEDAGDGLGGIAPAAAPDDSEWMLAELYEEEGRVPGAATAPLSDAVESESNGRSSGSETPESEDGIVEGDETFHTVHRPHADLSGDARGLFGDSLYEEMRDERAAATPESEDGIVEGDETFHTVHRPHADPSDDARGLFGSLLDDSEFSASGSEEFDSRASESSSDESEEGEGGYWDGDESTGEGGASFLEASHTFHDEPSHPDLTGDAEGLFGNMPDDDSDNSELTVTSDEIDKSGAGENPFDANIGDITAADSEYFDESALEDNEEDDADQEDLLALARAIGDEAGAGAAGAGDDAGYWDGDEETGEGIESWEADETPEYPDPSHLDLTDMAEGFLGDHAAEFAPGAAGGGGAAYRTDTTNDHDYALAFHAELHGIELASAAIVGIIASMQAKIEGSDLG
ncbi:MAG: hypothetical protein RLN62_05225 [Rickettsiales bacterium]